MPEGETVDVGTKLAVIAADAPPGGAARSLAAEPEESEATAEAQREGARPRAHEAAGRNRGGGRAGGY